MTLNPDDAAEPVDPYAPDDNGQDDAEQPEHRDTGDAELTNDGTDDGDDTDTTTG